MFDPEHPYNDLPFLPPSQDIETPAILKACTKAARELAKLDGASEKLPDPRILLVTLPLQEARNSSAIENIITTSNNLFQAIELGDVQADPNTKEVLRYRRAMELGNELLQEKNLLTTSLLENVCTTLKGADMHVRRVSGTKLENASTKKVIYMPPEGETLLRDLLGNLEKFIHEDNQIDPLVKMAIIHYQFEAIHPFSDGNGRTGRILNILYLMQQKLLSMPILYLSRYFIDHREDYYNQLAQVTLAHEWETWILYMLKALEVRARATHQKINEISALFNQNLEKAKEIAPIPRLKELMELTFTRPYIQIQTVEKELGISKQTATKYLKKWEEAKLLSTIKMGRNLLFINHELLKLLVEDEEDK